MTVDQALHELNWLHDQGMGSAEIIVDVGHDFATLDAFNGYPNDEPPLVHGELK